MASLFLGASALVAAGLPLVWLRSRSFKLAPRLPALDDPRREVRIALLVTVAVYAAPFLPPLVASSGTSSLTDPTMVVQVAVTHSILLVPIVVAAAATRQSWAGLVLSRRALFRMHVLGLVPGALYVCLVDLMHPVVSLPGAVPLALGLAGLRSPRALLPLGSVHLEKVESRPPYRSRSDSAIGSYSRRCFLTLALRDLICFRVSRSTYAFPET